MKYLLLSIYFQPYLIGVIFGLIYMFLFVDVKSFQSNVSGVFKLIMLLILGFLYLISFSIFMISIFGISHFSNLSTNTVYSCLMAGVCFLSAFYFFGFINFPKITFNKNRKSHSKFTLRAFSRLFLNFHFLWILFNSALFSISIFHSSISIFMSSLGIYTAILFSLLINHSISYSS